MVFLEFLRIRSSHSRSYTAKGSRETVAAAAKPSAISAGTARSPLDVHPVPDSSHQRLAPKLGRGFRYKRTFLEEQQQILVLEKSDGNICENRDTLPWSSLLNLAQGTAHRYYRISAKRPW
jgi:hypothetical protein